MSLQVLLQRHSSVIGNDCERLGRASGSYLCYQGGRFTLVKRSWLQRIFEKILTCLGCKRGTDLKAIAHQLAKEPDVPAALARKIRDAWRRTFLHLTCPIPLGDEELGETPFPAQPREFQAPAPRAEALPPPAQAAPLAQPYRLQVDGAILSLERGKITEMAVEAIVNPVELPRELRVRNVTYPRDTISWHFNGPKDSISYEIFQAAGAALITGECRRLLLEREEERERDLRIVGRVLPEDIAVFKTSAGRLPAPIAHIFHLVAPHHNHESDFSTRANLKIALQQVLYRAQQQGIKSLAFPLFDRWGHPPLLVIETCWDAIQHWLHLRENRGVLEKVVFAIDGTPTFFREAKEKVESHLLPFSEKI